MDNVAITSDNYVDKEDDDVPGIDDNSNITEDNEDEKSFLDDEAVEIDDLEEFKDPLPPEDTTKDPMFQSVPRAVIRVQGEKVMKPDYALMLVLAMEKALLL